MFGSLLFLSRTLCAIYGSQTSAHNIPYEPTCEMSDRPNIPYKINEPPKIASIDVIFTDALTWRILCAIYYPIAGISVVIVSNKYTDKEYLHDNFYAKYYEHDRHHEIL